MTLDRNLKNNLNEIGKVYEKKQWQKKTSSSCWLATPLANL